MITHEYDKPGNHRIVLSSGRTSDWVGYSQIAFLDGIYAATNFWPWFPHLVFTFSGKIRQALPFEERLVDSGLGVRHLDRDFEA